ncbi:unnamed protein product [Bemisia tabaci]|uniref:Uncharacterized protein n=2 Tax=Bemisia tabaci TaxID=7038 RepID=A0A9P0AHL6_BEMTA|nr:unnamed protein product [Bemisia tabaci]
MPNRKYVTRGRATPAEFSNAFVNASSPQQSYNAGAHIVQQGQQQRSGGRRTNTNSKGSRSSNRQESHRSKQNQDLQEALNRDLTNKLLPGVKTGENAASRLESYNTNRAVVIAITTRQMGFGVACIFTALAQMPPNRVPVGGTLYEYYRVAIFTHHAKMHGLKKAFNLPIRDNLSFDTPFLSSDFQNVVRSYIILPDCLSRPINQIGVVKEVDVSYFPMYARDTLAGGERFVPRPENITATNLRQTVEALSLAATPVAERIRFYQNNPIPGCQWDNAPQNPLLLNPNEIIPANFTFNDLNDDVEAITGKSYALAGKGGRSNYNSPPQGKKRKAKKEDGRTRLDCSDFLECFDRGDWDAFDTKLHESTSYLLSLNVTPGKVLEESVPHKISKTWITNTDLVESSDSTSKMSQEIFVDEVRYLPRLLEYPSEKLEDVPTLKAENRLLREYVANCTETNQETIPKYSGMLQQTIANYSEMLQRTTANYTAKITALTIETSHDVNNSGQIIDVEDQENICDATFGDVLPSSGRGFDISEHPICADGKSTEKDNSKCLDLAAGDQENICETTFGNVLPSSGRGFDISDLANKLQPRNSSQFKF